MTRGSSLHSTRIKCENNSFITATVVDCDFCDDCNSRLSPLWRNSTSSESAMVIFFLAGLCFSPCLFMNTQNSPAEQLHFHWIFKFSCTTSDVICLLASLLPFDSSLPEMKKQEEFCSRFLTRALCICLGEECLNSHFYIRYKYKSHETELNG